MSLNIHLDHRVRCIVQLNNLDYRNNLSLDEIFVPFGSTRRLMIRVPIQEKRDGLFRMSEARLSSTWSTEEYRILKELRYLLQKRRRDKESTNRQKMRKWRRKQRRDGRRLKLKESKREVFAKRISVLGICCRRKSRRQLVSSDNQIDEHSSDWLIPEILLHPGKPLEVTKAHVQFIHRPGITSSSDLQGGKCQLPARSLPGVDFGFLRSSRLQPISESHHHYQQNRKLCQCQK